METRLFYDTDGIKVSSGELIVNGSRYYLDDVNAVFVTKKVNHRKYPITLGILNLLGGSISLDISSGFATFCFTVALICFIIAFLMRTKYILRLRTRFGENIPLISTNQSELLAIREAILQALGQRTIL
ncbi:MAG: DUF6232 family protein [Parabacteroides gordonii]|nr:DUF6232 family protein [Parabacteroides gordonii]